MAANTVKLEADAADADAALAADSAELPLVAALLAEQAKIKDHEKQPVDHGFASFEFDK